jgi:hypothetical protein
MTPASSTEGIIIFRVKSTNSGVSPVVFEPTTHGLKSQNGRSILSDPIPFSPSVRAFAIYTQGVRAGLSCPVLARM